MDEDLQNAYKIIKKEFGKRRYKIVDSIDKIKNKCIMIDLNKDYSKIVLYYHDKNWENVDDILEICHHGNKFCDKLDECNDIHRDILDLYSYGCDGSEDEAFYIYDFM